MLVSSRGASAVADLELHTQTGSDKVEMKMLPSCASGKELLELILLRFYLLDISR